MEIFSEMVEFGIEIGKKAGVILMDYYKKDFKVESKAYNDFVTDADKASEEFLIKAIQEKYPTHSIFAEETGKHDKGSNVRWIIDPLDGTSNFAHRIPFFNVSITIEIEEIVVGGIVFAPYLNELFVAEKGKGAYLNGEKIKVSDVNEKEFCCFATGFHPNPDTLDKTLKIFNNILKDGYLVRRLGAAALDLSYVACGRLDGFWEYQLKPYDVGAGSLIVEEAGGKVSDENGDPLVLDCGSIVATNGKTQDTLLEYIRKNS